MGKDFQLVTGRHMSRITRADGDINGLGIDVLLGRHQGLSPELTLSVPISAFS